jgi:hypothetical protein
MERVGRAEAHSAGGVSNGLPASAPDTIVGVRVAWGEAATAHRIKADWRPVELAAAGVGAALRSDSCAQSA